MTHPSVNVQIAPEAVPSIPSWFGEVAVLAHVLTQFGILVHFSNVYGLPAPGLVTTTRLTLSPSSSDILN